MKTLSSVVFSHIGGFILLRPTETPTNLWSIGTEGQDHVLSIQCVSVSNVIFITASISVRRNVCLQVTASLVLVDATVSQFKF